MSTLSADTKLANFGRAAAEPDSPVQGITLIVFGIGIFSLQDVIIRSIGDTYSGFEIVFIRGLVAIGPIFLLVVFNGGLRSLKVPNFGLNLLRGCLGLSSYMAYYMSLQALPLAEATAIFFTAPLVVTMLSALVLRESIGMRRWSAILIGFAGVLMIVQPSQNSLSPASVLPFLAACTYATSIIITRHVGKMQSGASIAFYSMLVFTVVSGLAGLLIGRNDFNLISHPSVDFLLRPWVMPTILDAGIIGICGLIAASGFYCLAQGYKVAPASIVAPFEFIAMPLAVLWGWVVWSEVPNFLAFLGITTIIASGLYVLKREGLSGKKRLTTGRGIRFRL